MTRFDKLTGNQSEAEERKEYFIPSFNPRKATHLGVKDGKIAFFWSPSRAPLKSANHWHLWPIPPWAENYKFLIFRRTSSGWNYGTGPLFLP